MPIRNEFLTEWKFALGETEKCLTGGKSVCLPHTWNVEQEGEEITGIGWYMTALPASTLKARERAFLRFRGAYRDTEVSVNGEIVSRHTGSGYTPFTVEITSALHTDRENTLLVRTDNRFSSEALPFGKSFDWANDGGLYRPVELRITGETVLKDVRIHAQPVLMPVPERQDKGYAVFGFDAEVDGFAEKACLHWSLYRGAADSIHETEERPICSGVLTDAGGMEPCLLENVQYWHFDRPELYTLKLSLRLPDGTESDTRTLVFGFRSLILKGDAWFFNGEKVRLPGMEWMPGSNPALGMAENREDLEGMLRLLRESNSVLTRFHWQQDDWVYDWCDRHGLLVQEEIPFWGKEPQTGPMPLWSVARQQLEEMIRAHRHHPSIIAWGVGNELAGNAWPTQHYIRRAVAFAKSLDDSRLVNYVSNTAFADPIRDGSCEGDIAMVNDYIGTWHQGYEQAPAWQALLDAHPGRAFIPSEFGLCEPAFKGGDPRREEIFLEKLRFYRTQPQIAGTVYFCLNDYRTHMGEEGEGRMRRRVHGSADLLGKPKPSYFAVQREYAPLIAERTEKGMRLICRNNLPSYQVRGYILRNGEDYPIPDLNPGESWMFEGEIRKDACVLRPLGETVMKLEQDSE